MIAQGGALGKRAQAKVKALKGCAWFGGRFKRALIRIL